MVKKLTYGFLLIFFVIAFTRCDEGCNNIPADKIPVFRQGDTLIYTIDNGKKDTFQVTKFIFGSMIEGDARVCYQTLYYDICKINKSNVDTSGFYKIHHYQKNTAYWFDIYLTRTGERGVLPKYDCDSLYKNISIGGKAYTSVYYYVLRNKDAPYKNFYFSYQYGLLSIEINDHLVYLSEIKQAR
jgi:hypothetical protein